MMKSSFAFLLLLPSALGFSPTQRSDRASTRIFADATATATPFSIGGPSEALLDLFNSQVTKEFAASHLYLSASIWFEIRDWEGMASYMLGESSEERGHALSMIEFANKRNIPIALQSLPAPTGDWNTPEEVWADLLRLEQCNTKSLLKVAEAANECQDFAVLAFLSSFHLEQVESEATIGTILAKVRDENQTPGLLRQLDQELGSAGGA